MAKISEFVDRAHVFFSSSLPQFLPRKITREGAYSEDADGFSELPDSICHDILGRLSITDARMTSFLSRRWRFMWHSSPFFNFDEERYTKDGYKSFAKFVNGTLKLHQRYLEDSCIELLKLRIVSASKDNADILENSIEFARQRRVKEVHLITEYTPTACLRSVLTCQLITILKLGECSIKPTDSIHLPALRTLALANVHMSDGVLEKFLSSCPSIENLCLQYLWWASSFNICSNKLKFLLLESFFILRTATIQAPNLEYLYFMNDRFPTELKIAKCRRLKFLFLHYAEGLQNHELEDLIVKNHHLERLELTTCPTLQHTTISSQRLQHLVLRNCRNLIKLHIDAPHLQSFDLTSFQKLLEVKIDAPRLHRLNYAGRLITLSKVNSLNLMETEIYLDSTSDVLWYIKLKKLLEKCEHSYILRLECWEDKQLVVPNDMRERLLPQLCRLQHLKVRISKSTMSHAELEDGMRWIFPCLSTLDIETDQTDHEVFCNSAKVLRDSVATPSLWRSIRRKVDEVASQFRRDS